MQNYIASQDPKALLLNRKVTALAPTADGESMNVTVVEEDNNSTSTFTYTNVISTLPLTCLRSMDIYSCNLTPMQSNALRELDYGPSIKIGIKFKTAWWTTGTDQSGQPFKITGGQSYTDRPIRTVVYPSYGLADQTDQPTTVLIASYCWTNDAERVGALIGTGQTQYDQQLLTIALRDLADVHNVTYEYLANQIADPKTDVYAWDWNHNPLTLGMLSSNTLVLIRLEPIAQNVRCICLFRPRQIPESLPKSHCSCWSSVLRRRGSESPPRVSVCAGFEAVEILLMRTLFVFLCRWVVGALDSVWQAINVYLQINHPEMLSKFYDLWGTNMDWVNPTSTYNPGDGPIEPSDNLLLQNLLIERPDLFT
jgi:hypothetical protein